MGAQLRTSKDYTFSEDSGSPKCRVSRSSDVPYNVQSLVRPCSRLPTGALWASGGRRKYMFFFGPMTMVWEPSRSPCVSKILSVGTRAAKTSIISHGRPQEDPPANAKCGRHGGAAWFWRNACVAGKTVTVTLPRSASRCRRDHQLGALGGVLLRGGRSVWPSSARTARDPRRRLRRNTPRREHHFSSKSEARAQMAGQSDMRPQRRADGPAPL